MVEEYRRTCNACGKVWHTLVGKEEELRRRLGANASQMVAGCGSPATSSQGMATSRLINVELEKLRTCPECGSSSYTEEIVTYEDPTAG